MRLLTIALKDIRQILHDKRSVMFLVLMPVGFTLFLGMAFRWPSHTDSRPVVGIAYADSTTSGSPIEELLAAGGFVRIRTFDGPTNADELVRHGDLDAAVVIPPGSKTGLESDSALEVICDQSSPSGLAALQAVEVAVGRMRLSAAAARIVARNAGEVRTLAAQARGLWQSPALVVHAEPVTGKAIRAATPNGFAQASPGTMVQFAIFSVMTAAMLLVLDRRSRTLGRLLSAPVSRATVIGGHVLAMFTVTFAQCLLLVGLGQLAFHVNYAAGIGAVLLVLAALALWVASLGLFIGTIAKGPEQVSMYSMVSMFFFAAGGGAWFPLEITGKAFSTFGHLLPSAWAMDGLQNIAVRGLGFGSVLVPVAVLVGYAGLFFALAVWRFRAE
jgi:ABC-2 type transport system permease protein